MRDSMRLGCLCAALALAPLAAPAAAPPPSEAVERALSAGGRARTYLLYVPAGLAKDKPSPLVLVFHGGEGDGRQIERHTGFDALAQQEGFVVAYPDGVGRHWNDGRENRDFQTYQEHVDDVAFVAALIDAIARERAIDPRRVYATGMSNGGILTQLLGARLSARLAAIAPVSGGLAEPLRAGFRPERPVSVLILHGTEDPLVPYHGGGVRRGTHGRILDTDETVRLWAAADGCDPAPKTDTLPDADPKDGCRVKCSRWSAGRGGTDVVLYTIEGGGHTWPGGRRPASRIRVPVGRVCRDFDATHTIWEFFQAHPRK